MGETKEDLAVTKVYDLKVLEIKRFPLRVKLAISTRTGEYDVIWFKPGDTMELIQTFNLDINLI